MKPKLLFRVDGGRVWGVSMGHLHRALILAKALAGSFEIVFVMKAFADGVAHALGHGVAVDTIAVDDDSDATLITCCRRHRPAVVVIDLFHCPYVRFFDHCRETGIVSVLFDIRGQVAGRPDAIINDSFVAELCRYPDRDERTAIYSGPAYFIMDGVPAVVPPAPAITKVMITMGGSDPAGVTAGVCRAVASWGRTPTTTVVLGPAFGSDAAVGAAIRGWPWMALVRSPDDFIGLLADQDLVVTSAGRTLYECAALGKPVITVATIEHEQVTAAEFSRLTASLDIGRWDPATGPERLVAALETCWNRADLRCSVHHAGRKLIDGLGLRRVVAIFADAARQWLGSGSPARLEAQG